MSNASGRHITGDGLTTVLHSADVDDLYSQIDLLTLQELLQLLLSAFNNRQVLMSALLCVLRLFNILQLARCFSVGGKRVSK